MGQASPPSWSICPGAGIENQRTQATGYQKKSIPTLNSREIIKKWSSCSQTEYCLLCWLLPAYTTASGVSCGWRRCQKKDSQRNFCAEVSNKSTCTLYLQQSHFKFIFSVHSLAFKSRMPSHRTVLTEAWLDRRFRTFGSTKEIAVISANGIMDSNLRLSFSVWISTREERTLY